MSNISAINATAQETLQEQIDELASNLISAKNLEESARKNRIYVEERIVSFIGNKSEGSFTAKGDSYSLTTSGKLTRTLLPDHLDAVRHDLPDAIFKRLISYKPSLVLKELRYIEANEPEMYAIAAKAFVTKPAKTSVTVKAVAQ